MSGSKSVASPGRNDEATRAKPGLVFIRPPKTASCSVENVIKLALGPSADYVVPAKTVQLGRVGALDAKHCFVRGHVTWNDAAWLVADPAAWRPIMTFRDPIERTLSHYRYLRQRASSARLDLDNEPLIRETLARPLRDLIHDESSGFFNWTMPIQTLFLGSTLRGRDPRHPLPDETRLLDDRGEALRCALGRLDRLAWIGIVESLDRDLRVLAFSQGWPVVDAPHANRTKAVSAESAAFSELDPATRQVLADRVAADYVLLESAREIAAERYREMVETFGMVHNQRGESA